MLAKYPAIMEETGTRSIDLNLIALAQESFWRLDSASVVTQRRREQTCVRIVNGRSPKRSISLNDVCTIDVIPWPEYLHCTALKPQIW